MPEATAMIQIKPQRVETIEVPIKGVTPLIVSRFDEKAKEMMLLKQQSKTRTAKEPKDPEKEYQSRRYLLPDGRDGSGQVKAGLARLDESGRGPAR